MEWTHRHTSANLLAYEAPGLYGEVIHHVLEDHTRRASVRIWRVDAGGRFVDGYGDPLVTDLQRPAEWDDAACLDAAMALIPETPEGG